MKKILTVVASALLIGGWMQTSIAVPVSDTQPNIAVVNVQQLFQSSPKIAELNKKLQSQFKGRQEKLASAQKNLQEELDKYKKESPTMSPKEKDSLQKKITDDQSTLAKDYSAFQQDLSKEQNKIMKGVLSQLNQIIGDLAKKSNYTLVLDSQAVIYSADNADITKMVAKEFDNK